MSKRNRLIIAGAIVGLLAIIVIYLNFFTGEGAVPEASEAIKVADEHAQNAPPTPPAPSTPAPKPMEPFKPGG